MKNKEKTPFGTMLLGIFIILFPFIAYCHVEFLGGQSREIFTHNEGYIYDFFLYYKEIILLSTAAVLCVMLLLEFVTSKKEERCGLFVKNAKHLWIFAGITAFLITASAVRCICSGYAEGLKMGTPVDYEGVFALLSYLVLFLGGYHFFRTDKQKHFLKICLLVLMALIGVLSLAEYCIEPLYQMPFMKYLIAPPQFRELAEALENVKYQGQVTLGSYNSGYFGGLCALLFPISLGMVYYAENFAKRIIRAFISAGVLFGLITSTSTGAFYAVVISIVMAVVVISAAKLLAKNKGTKIKETKNKKTKKNTAFLYSTISIVGGIVVFGVLAVLLSQGKFFSQMYKTTVHPNTVEVSDNLFKLSYLQIEENVIVARNTEGKEFNIKETAGVNTELRNLEIYAQNGKKLKTAVKEVPSTKTEFLTVDEKGYEGIVCYKQENVLMVDFGYEQPIPFYITDKGFFLVGKDETFVEKIPQPQITGMEKYYDFATGRGYTWVQSIPMLKKCAVLGTGVGTFAYNFKQNEAVGLINTHGSSLFVIDKPHSWYIQMAVNSGVLSVLLFIAMYIILLIKIIKSQIKNYNKNIEADIFKIAVLTGITAFMITGLVNDSVVSVNPLFWIMYGLAFSKSNEKFAI